MEAGFQRANAKAIQKAHAAGIAVPVLEDNGDGTLGDEVVWLHPDGVKRATSEPVHARQHR